jgi:hypothetical protein
MLGDFGEFGASAMANEMPAQSARTIGFIISADSPTPPNWPRDPPGGLRCVRRVMFFSCNCCD